MLAMLLQQVNQPRASYLTSIHTSMFYEVDAYWKTATSEGSNRKLIADMLVHRVLSCFTLTEHEEDTLTQLAREHIDGLPQ